MAKKIMGIMACSYTNPHTGRGVFVVATTSMMNEFFENTSWTHKNGGPRQIDGSVSDVVRMLERDTRVSEIAIRQTPDSPIYGGNRKSEAMIIVPPNELEYLEGLVYGSNSCTGK